MTGEPDQFEDDPVLRTLLGDGVGVGVLAVVRGCLPDGPHGNPITDAPGDAKDGDLLLGNGLDDLRRVEHDSVLLCNALERLVKNHPRPVAIPARLAWVHVVCLQNIPNEFAHLSHSTIPPCYR